MSPRRISPKTPNRIQSEPATVAACQQDRGSKDDQNKRQEAAAVQKGRFSSVELGFHADGEALR